MPLTTRSCLGVLLMLLPTSTALGQKSDWPSAQIPPVITRDTKASDWPELRSRIETRLALYLGTRPPHATLSTSPKFEELSRDTVSGLTRINYRYHVLDDAWTEASLILPADLKEGEKRPVCVIIHGTADAGRATSMDDDKIPTRAYAIQLARRGYITFAPDLWGYGQSVPPASRYPLYEAFDAKYPEWSQADRTIFGLQKGLDLLDTLPMVRTGEYASMGNSLGGGSTTRLMAADTRIKVGIASTGASPQVTNIYRLTNKAKGARLKADAIINKTGRTPYEISDLFALCAPRALMVIEPFDDPYNPDVTATFEAVRNAWMVWNLLGQPAKVNLLIHADGHNTVTDVRESAYRWIERWLPINAHAATTAKTPAP